MKCEVHIHLRGTPAFSTVSGETIFSPSTVQALSLGGIPPLRACLFTGPPVAGFGPGVRLHGWEQEEERERRRRDPIRLNAVPFNSPFGHTISSSRCLPREETKTGRKKPRSKRYSQKPTFRMVYIIAPRIRPSECPHHPPDLQ